MASKKYSSSRDISTTGTSRRQMLTASGLLTVGALSGCLGRVASATTNTGASPAAPFAGIGAYTGPSPTSEPTVYKLTPTVSADSGLLSGEVELEAWVTAQSIAATCCFDYNDGTSQINRANYNNSRSNRANIRGPDDTNSDGDGVELRSNALDLENQLLSQTTEAASVSKRSARTGRNPDTGNPIKEYFSDMMGTLDEIQDTLESCSDDVCVTVRDHAHRRQKLTQQAAAHVDNREWDHAAETLQEIQRIVGGDIELLEKSLQDTSEQSLESPQLQDLTGASDEDIAALYEYLAGEPVISLDAGDLDGDGYGDVMTRRLSGDGAVRGARLFDGTVSDAVAEGVLSEAEGEDIILRKKPGRTEAQDEDDGAAGNTVICQSNHLSAPIVHFTGASASDNLKFKAGAELSKSVN